MTAKTTRARTCTDQGAWLKLSPPQLRPGGITVTTQVDQIAHAEYIAEKRAMIVECLEKAVEKGWNPTPSVFVTTHDAQCCALGAIALCHKDMPTQDEYRDQVCSADINAPF